MGKKLLISADVGGSQTKIIYQFSDDAPQYLFMPPAVEEISKSDLEAYYQQLGWVGAPSVEHRAWLEWNDTIFVVGEFACEFAAVDRIFERKYENALYKLLAAVGVILSKHGISSKSRASQVDLFVGLLLPCNEYNDRVRFEEQFRAMLSQLRFCGESWKVNLLNFVCRPEGGGLVSTRIEKNGVDWLRSNKVVVLMFGHRNVTAIYFEDGAMKTNDSPLLGFSIFLDDVCKRVSGLDREKLASALFKGLKKSQDVIYREWCTKHPEWENLDAIKSLATARDKTLRKLEEEDIVKAIKLAIPVYWRRIEKWLDKQIPSMADEALIGGGAAVFLEPELEKYFNCQLDKSVSNYSQLSSSKKKARKYFGRKGERFSNYTRLIWFEETQEEIEKTFNLSLEDSKSQSVRLIDCFGMFNHLKGIAKENAKSQKSA